MRVLDLFSGIGGFSLGLERAGMETVAFCEIEPFNRAVLKKHWPDVPCHGDVRALDGREYEPDVICGGFPCQDISNAGKRAGIEGENSGLWSEYARIIGGVRPRYVIVENVSALLRRGFERVLGDMAALGYDAEWHCIPAAYVGAPHGRDRLWIIAYPKRDQQSRQEPRFGTLGRMGREQQSVPWDRTWQDTLAALRRMDDGLSRSVDRTDALRNAVVPQITEAIGRAIMDYENAALAAVA